MKRSCFLVLLLLLCLLLPGCHNSEQPVLAPETVPPAPESRDAGRFNGPLLTLDYTLQSWELHPEGSPAQVAYSDAFFNAIGGQASGDLALLSASLINTLGNEQDAQFLADMGFTVLGRENWTPQERGDYVAYTVASRQLPAADGETYTIYSIALRGSRDTAEWLSNLNLGKDTVHAGWQIATNQVLDSLSRYITTDPAHTLLWITGHSRGAAVGSLLAAALNESQTYAPPAQIAAYLFACPAFTLKPLAADNIFNFLVPNDPAAGSFFAIWGYGRHGQDILLPETSREQAGAIFQAYTGDEYQGGLDLARMNELLLAWCPQRDSYDTPAGDSPYDRLTTLLPQLMTTEQNVSSLLTIAFQNRFSGPELACGRFLLLHGAQVLQAHDSQVYVCWLNAVYGQEQ